ncbi:MAG: tRNA pseudouridine(38-40) synthase TruA [Clostridia bacterium]|nr:tRNA pseudouridine(38-40) synthase TruA [Clostridia bacterium]MBQ9786161.1 tRNA pseudouridine(38-40) synthase TruA [Clostridia bacterium]
MKRIKMIVQYKGTNYSGWQKQKNSNSIQEEIEKAIFLALYETVEVVGSGRTDAGVHAVAQVCHFDTNTKIAPNKLFAVINKFLPNDIKILQSEQVDDEFNARFSAKQKTYEYHFYSSELELPLLKDYCAKVRTDFDFELALKACSYFVGEYDFKAFCSAGAQVKSTVRTIYNISLAYLPNGTYCLSVTGNGFLYNMVRIIAGTIIEVGCGKINPDKIPEIILSKNRENAGKTAPACGLFLKNVDYNV